MENNIFEDCSLNRRTKIIFWDCFFQLRVSCSLSLLANSFLVQFTGVLLNFNFHAENSNRFYFYPRCNQDAYFYA